MKKIITLALLLLTTCFYAQKKEFILVFNKSVLTDENNVSDDVKHHRTLFTFNYLNEDNRVLIETGGVSDDLTQTGYTEDGQTTGGHKYKMLTMVDSYGNKIGIQLFLDKKYGVRLIFPDGSDIHFVK